MFLHALLFEILSYLTTFSSRAVCRKNPDRTDLTHTEQYPVLQVTKKSRPYRGAWVSFDLMYVKVKKACLLAQNPSIPLLHSRIPMKMQGIARNIQPEL
jgi:hypothetical protein